MTDVSNLLDNEDLKTIIKNFRKYYEPVENEEDSDYLFTTTEILDAISEFSHSDFKGLYKLLIAEGFTYKPIAKNDYLKFVWMVKNITVSESDS
jgi:hypothetical protein